MAEPAYKQDQSAQYKTDSAIIDKGKQAVKDTWDRNVTNKATDIVADTKYNQDKANLSEARARADKIYNMPVGSAAEAKAKQEALAKFAEEIGVKNTADIDQWFQDRQSELDSASKEDILAGKSMDLSAKGVSKKSEWTDNNRAASAPNDTIDTAPATAQANDNATAQANDNATANTATAQANDTTVEAEAEAIEQADSPKEVSESVSGKMESDRAKKDIVRASRDVWSAWENGEFGNPDTPDAKQARNYFLLDSLMTSAKNWSNIDRQHLNNLYSAVNGQPLDFSDTETNKSKWQQRMDNALNRAEKGQDTLAESDYSTAADIGTTAAQAQAGQELGTEGMANTAMYNSAKSGNIDVMTAGLAEGNPEAVKSFKALLKSPQTEQRLNELELQLKQGTLPADIKQAFANLNMTNINNELTRAGLPIVQNQADLIRTIKGVADGTVTLSPSTMASFGGMLAAMKLIG